MERIQEKLSIIGESIREKTGKTELLSLDEMPAEIAAIETGIKTDDATAVAGDILSGKTAYAKDVKITGTIPTKTQGDLTVSGATVTVPAGYYATGATKSVATATRANTTISVSADDTNDKLIITASNNQSTGYITGANKTATATISLTASGAIVTASDGTNKVSKSVATATQATPSISVDSAGKITASSTQTEGYVTAGTKTATKQLTTKAAATITPSTSNQTIAAGIYLTGTQTIAGDADLKTANIKKGVNIFGVEGSYTDLNFDVVGGTTQPENPIENTIWVNTSTISSWIVDHTMPENPTPDMVWIKAVLEGPIGVNIHSTNKFYFYPSSVMQYVNNSWVSRTAKILKDGKWVNFSVIPSFTYTGTYTIVDDNDNEIVESADNWKIRFLTSGTLIFTDLKSAADGIDIFLVGGGGGGGGAGGEYGQGGGGGSGYTTTKKAYIPKVNTSYTITIGGGGAGGVNGARGGNGGTTSAFESTITASGGQTGNQGEGWNGGSGGSGGGTGGSGGHGGSDGSNGIDGASTSPSPGRGQGRTTREFGESEARLYAGGGGGANGNGGAGGGGQGGSYLVRSGQPGVTNTGGGGGGGAEHWQHAGGAGGSGIVIIRNKRG